MKRMLVCALIAALAACTTKTTQQAMNTTGDNEFKKFHDAYVVEFLRRNPTVNTYLGGAGLDPSLKDVDGMLRDHSAAALETEDRWLADWQKSLEGIDPNTLSANLRIDREVALAQIRFLLHQHQVRRYQERALDTYVTEPFRSLDWQMQGMTQTGDKTYGTAEEWALVAKRVQAIPKFLANVRDQLLAGIKSNNTPDRRMIMRDGLETSKRNAEYFEKEFPKLAGERMTTSQNDPLRATLQQAAKEAAEAYRALEKIVESAFIDTVSGSVKSEYAADRFAMGEAEYDWALK